MKRFYQPVCPLCRLPKSFVNRMVVHGLALIVIVSLFQTGHQAGFAAAPLLPKRTVPQRTQSQAVPNTIIWPKSDSDTNNYLAITKDSLIQQVAFDDEEPDIMIPPAPPVPPLRKPRDTGTPGELKLFSYDPLSESEVSPDGSDDGDEANTFAEDEDAQELNELANFPPLDAPQYKFPAVPESTTAIPQTSTPSVPSTFVSDQLAPLPLAMNTMQQGSVPLLGQTPSQNVNPYAQYNDGVKTSQTAYGFTPYGYPQTPAAYVNPYGYGPYGYPNTPGAYWGPTGFTPNPYTALPYANPYVAYPGYPTYPPYPPYGYRPINQTAADDDASDSLSGTMWETLGYFNPLKSPKGPNRGVGGPLMMRSWRDRPYYLGAFGGLMTGGELISGLVDQDNGGTGGIIFGWYADNYWGLESRLHFAGLPSKDTEQGQLNYEEWYRLQNDDATFVPRRGSRNNAISMLDVSVHYYPLGNAKWRPYLKLGIGTANQQFRDMYGEKHTYNSFMIPWGIGLKYWWNERIAMQMELTDNVIFAVEEAKTQNNVALTVGLNFPLGKIKRKDPVIYWPMIPSAGR